MTLSKKGPVLLGAALAATLVLGACSSSSGGSKSPSSSASGTGSGAASAATTSKPAVQAAANTNDIAATPYANVKAGGTMHWPVEDFPADFNNLTVNGNESASIDIMTGTMPQVWNFTAAGTPVLDTDTMTSAVQTSASPQTIEYKINPKAVWSNGTKISYKDFVGLWASENGKNTKFQDASTTGYSQIKSVTEGANAQDVKVVFSSPFADWKSLFSELWPAELTASPTTFNKSWNNGPKPNISGGPFIISKIDKTQKTITEIRNPKWYGRPAKLDSIQFIDLDVSAQPKAFQSGQVDWFDIGSDPAAYATARSVPGATIHKAGGPNFRHIDLSKRGFLANVNVRRAVMLSINRVGDAKAQLAPLGLPTTVLNSHIWMNNQAQYKSTCGAYCNQDIAKAKTLLEGQGFKLNKAGYYAKGGKELDLHFVIPAGVTASANEAELQQGALKAAGIKVILQTVGSDPFFPNYILKGAYDLTIFSWLGTPFPVSASQAIYSQKGDSNFGGIGTPQIDALFKKAVATTNVTTENNLSYQIDEAIWAEGHSVTLYQRPDLVATKKGLVNFGSFGFANKDYTDIGFNS